MGITVALYSHDSVGLGHARRNRAIAYALAEHLPRLTGHSVGGLLIAGHPEAARDALPPGWDWLVLPGVAPTASGHAPRQLEMSLAELAAVRGAIVDAALAAMTPDLFIVDRHPFGVAGELRSAVRRQRHRGGRTVLGLREVLDDPVRTSKEWDRLGGPAAVAAAYDAVWIYGDPSIYDPRLSGEVPAPMARIATATGYLSHGRPDSGPTGSTSSVTGNSGASGASGASGVSSAAPEPQVLTVLGGGSDGAALARVAAQSVPPAGHRHLVVTGPQMSTAEVAEIRALAGDRTIVVQRADHLPGLIDRAGAVVCMAGYNTLAEVMATSTPALVVPRDHRRDEQRRRAVALATAGAVDTHPLATLTPDRVTRFFADAVERRVDRAGIDLAGLTRVPRLAAELLSTRAVSPTGSLAGSPTGSPTGSLVGSLAVTPVRLKELDVHAG